MEGMLPGILRRASGRVNSKYVYFLKWLDKTFVLAMRAPCRTEPTIPIHLDW
jgi:hypothetical protein